MWYLFIWMENVIYVHIFLEKKKIMKNSNNWPFRKKRKMKIVYFAYIYLWRALTFAFPFSPSTLLFHLPCPCNSHVHFHLNSERITIDMTRMEVDKMKYCGYSHSFSIYPQLHAALTDSMHVLLEDVCNVYRLYICYACTVWCIFLQ